jgi:hypothetical protein
MKGKVFYGFVIIKSLVDLEIMEYTNFCYVSMEGKKFVSNNIDNL